MSTIRICIVESTYERPLNKDEILSQLIEESFNHKDWIPSLIYAIKDKIVGTPRKKSKY